MRTKLRFEASLKVLLTFLMGTLLLAACTSAATVANPPVNATSLAAEVPTQIEASPSSVPATTVPAADIPATAVPTSDVPATFVAIAQPLSDTGTAVTLGPLSLVVPPGVASGASVSELPRNDSEDAAWWQKTPGHLQVMLGDYYVLQGQLHQPQIVVYPAQGYAELVPAAFESIRRVDNILYGSGGPIGVEQLPAVPFLNAQPVFAAGIETVSFRNGSGVRFLTQYAQGHVPVNNDELFYQFHGVTRDGAYYIVAILPVTVPILAETGEPGEPLPSGGITAPDITDPNADWVAYYSAVADLLNGKAPDVFSPAIDQLDLLIESMQVAP